ncbi:uncharacterized [Tachysurus ichikawai]
MLKWASPTGPGLGFRAEPGVLRGSGSLRVLAQCVVLHRKRREPMRREIISYVQWVLWSSIDLQEEGLRGSEAPWSPGLHRNCSGLMETAHAKTAKTCCLRKNLGSPARLHTATLHLHRVLSVATAALQQGGDAPGRTAAFSSLLIPPAHRKNWGVAVRLAEQPFEAQSISTLSLFS